MRKPAFCICEDADQLRGNREADQRLCFHYTDSTIPLLPIYATQIVQSLYFLYTKFQASSHLVWLYSLVCVGPGWKPRRLVFSERGSYTCGSSLVVFPPSMQAAQKSIQIRSGTLFCGDSFHLPLILKELCCQLLTKGRALNTGKLP